MAIQLTINGEVTTHDGVHKACEAARASLYSYYDSESDAIGGLSAAADKAFVGTDGELLSLQRHQLLYSPGRTFVWGGWYATLMPIGTRTA